MKLRFACHFCSWPYLRNEGPLLHYNQPSTFSSRGLPSRASWNGGHSRSSSRRAQCGQGPNGWSGARNCQTTSWRRNGISFQEEVTINTKCQLTDCLKDHLASLGKKSNFALTRTLLHSSHERTKVLCLYLATSSTRPTFRSRDPSTPLGPTGCAIWKSKSEFSERKGRKEAEKWKGKSSIKGWRCLLPSYE